MSTFGGKIQEIPNISVDRFDEYNLESEAYFLSHCHSDHMVGLYTWVFQNNLIYNNKFLYVSDVSCEILKKLYPEIRNNIKVLDMYAPTLIMLKNKCISVTPLPAGHCPGSVMFLFECDNICILYTGDYRIRENDIKEFKQFYNSHNEVKVIDKIYLDTTFFLKRYLRFPKRKESLNELCKIIKEWTDKGKNYWVKLFTSAKYGYESVFNGIYKQMRMPVHVNCDVYKIYSIIPEMDNSVTMDGSLTQIHSNCGPTYQSICEHFNSKLRTIKISAIRWQQNDLENGISSSESDTYCVCYSTHASYEEGRGLIKFLKPRNIEACVKYDDPHKNLEIMNLIKEILDEIKNESSEEDEPKFFETKTEITEAVSNSLESDSSFNDNFKILDSPPRYYKQTDFTQLHKVDSKLGGVIKTLEEKTEFFEIEKTSQSFNSESCIINDIVNFFPTPNKENVIDNAGLQVMDKFETKGKIEGLLEMNIVEKISHSFNSESSIINDIVNFSSRPNKENVIDNADLQLTDGFKTKEETDGESSLLETNVVEQTSRSFNSESCIINDIVNFFPRSNQENVIDNAGLQVMDGFKTKEESEGKSSLFETEENIYSLSSGSSSCSYIIILDSPPREIIEIEQETLQEHKSEGNDISIVDFPPRKRTK